MPRVLTAVQVTVSSEREADYVATLARLAARMRSRGEHLWLFRDPAAPGAFLECSEGGSGAERPRTRRRRDAEEAALEQRLDAIASYAPGTPVLWEEVSLEER